MASAEDGKEPEWVERVRSEGAVPLLEPGNCPNGWACPSGDSFMVRGPEYLSNKVKIPGGKYLLKSLGFDWIRTSTKLCDLLSHRKNRVRKAVDEAFPTSDKPFIWAFNLQLPTKDNYSAVAYFVSTEPIPEGSLMDQFLKGDDEFRNSRLKLIANIVKGPWIVRKAVGEQAICIIGRALSCKYCISENFCEVDIDIGSSMVASAIVHLAFGYITTLTVDLAFLIESQTETELPEQLLGAVRFSELKPDSAQFIEPSSYGSSGNLQASLPTRLWKSLGHGFSQLIHPGAQESGSVSTSTTQVNGAAGHDESDGDVKKCWSNMVCAVSKIGGIIVDDYILQVFTFVEVPPIRFSCLIISGHEYEDMIFKRPFKYMRNLEKFHKHMLNTLAPKFELHMLNNFHNS